MSEVSRTEEIVGKPLGVKADLAVSNPSDQSDQTAQSELLPLPIVICNGETACSPASLPLPMEAHLPLLLFPTLLPLRVADPV